MSLLRISHLLSQIDHFRREENLEYLDSARWELFQLLSSSEKAISRLFKPEVIDGCLRELKVYLREEKRSRFAHLLSRLKVQRELVQGLYKVVQSLKRSQAMAEGLTRRPEHPAFSLPKPEKTLLAEIQKTSDFPNYLTLSKDFLSDCIGRLGPAEVYQKGQIQRLGHLIGQIIRDVFTEKEEIGVKTLLVETKRRAGFVGRLLVQVYENGRGKINSGVVFSSLQESKSVNLSLTKARDAAFSYLSSLGFFGANPNHYDLSWQLVDLAPEYGGSSLSLSFALAIVAQLTDSSIDPEMAFTGEVELDCRIRAIDGIGEKVIAAHKAGVKTLFIPKDNLTELSPTLSYQELKIVPVEHLSEVCDSVFGIGILKERILESSIRYRPEPLPLIKDFVGRRKELTHLSSLPQGIPFLVIEGIAGMGKTVLGAELARRVAKPDGIFWFPSKSLPLNRANILGQLALFLWKRGNPRLLHNIKEGRPELQSEVLIESLEDGKEKYLLCFDDFQNLSLDDKETKLLFSGLMRRLRRTRVIIMSRSKPRFYTVREVRSGLVYEHLLSGLNPKAIVEYMEGLGLGFTQREAESLYRILGGHPLVLRFISDSLRRGTPPGQNLAERLPQEIEDALEYLFQESWQDLKGEEKRLLAALSLFRTHFPWEALEAIEEEGRVEALRGLEERFLVNRRKVDGNFEIHDSIRALISRKRLLDRRGSSRINRLIARYYEEKGKDDLVGFLESAHYYFQASSYDEGVRALAENQTVLWNCGYAQQLIDLLREVSEGRLSPRSWLEARLTLADSYAFIDDYDRALKGYYEILERGQQVPSGIFTPRKYAEIYEDIAFIYEKKGDFAESLNWHRKGLSILKGDGNSVEKARLLIGIGWIRCQEGRTSDGLRWLKRGLRIVEGTEHIREVAMGYNDLGNAYQVRGEYQKAEEYYLKALEIWEKIGAGSGKASTLNNLGALYYLQGRYEEALPKSKESLRLWGMMGGIHDESDNHNNIANIYLALGDYEQAIDGHLKALQIRERFGDRYGVFVSTANLGNTYLDSGDLDLADDYLDRALNLVEEVEGEGYLSELYSLKGEVSLKRERLKEAKSWAQRALQMALKNKEKRSEAAACRQLGEVFRAMAKKDKQSGERGKMGDEFEKSLHHLEKSLSLFKEINSEHEVGKTLYELGLLYQVMGRAKEAREYFSQAKEILREVKAKGDLERVSKAEEELGNGRS